VVANADHFRERRPLTPTYSEAMVWFQRLSGPRFPFFPSLEPLEIAALVFAKVGAERQKLVFWPVLLSRFWYGDDHNNDAVTAALPPLRLTVVVTLGPLLEGCV
jgi:hypothetical protein